MKNNNYSYAFYVRSKVIARIIGRAIYINLFDSINLIIQILFLVFHFIILYQSSLYQSSTFRIKILKDFYCKNI